MPKGVMWRQEDIYMSAIGGDGNALLGVPPVKDLDDVAARARTGSPLVGTLTLCPLMHGGGFWLAFSAILDGSFSVLIRDVGFDPTFALRVIGEERVRLLMTIGDAYARPIVDVLDSCDPGEYDLSSLLVYGSGGAILSPSVSADLARVLPTTFVHDGFGASETGGQGRLTGTGADGAPRFDMDASNVVIAEDGTVCKPGDGQVGMLATSGHIPLGYYKDEAKTAATFPVIDGVRYAVPGDLASVDADGSIVVYGRGSVSINSGGEKIFPDEVEKALKRHPAVFDATVVGTPNVALRLAGHRGGGAAARALRPRARARRAAGALPRASRGIQGAARGGVRRRDGAITFGEARLPLGQRDRARRAHRLTRGCRVRGPTFASHA